MKAFTLFGILLPALILSLSPAFAIDNAKELNDYTEIQTLLAKDNFAGVTEASKKLSVDAKANHHEIIAEKADKLAQTTDIKNARDVFVPLSKEMLPLVKADKSKNFEIVYCPMKKEKWVQKKGPVANPYYGKEMLDCGVKE